MKYLVYDIAASESGALSVLKDFYSDVIKNDVLNEWVFVVSTVGLVDTERVKVLNYSWTKKSWLHRIYFEYFIINKIIKRESIDIIVSLQNTILPRISLTQYVYMHNSIPFVDYKFKFSSNKLLWIYQNVISRVIFLSLRRANYIFVQANWVKKKCIDKLGILENKIEVVPPKMNLVSSGSFKKNDSKVYKRFFYPATAFEYKNHMCILEALKLMTDEQKEQIEVYFTISKNENKYTNYLFEFVKDNKLPVSFLGRISRERVSELYNNSILVFPSLVESSPLPLSEAKIQHSIIYSADIDYAHDILDEYENKYYFNSSCSEELFELMINSGISMYKPVCEEKKVQNYNSLLEALLLIKNIR